MHILLVTKDKGSFNFVEPGYRELIKRGHRVRIVAEGLSADLWPKTGAEIVQDGKELLHDVIVVGTSAPANLEQVYADFANVSGIPLVLAEDSFGASSRIDGDAKLILTINDIAGDLIGKGRHKSTPWKAVGSPAVATTGTTPELDVEYRALSGGLTRMVILYAGQGGPFTADILNKTLELVRSSQLPCTLVIKHHPKAHVEVNEEMLRGAFVMESSFGTDELARIADYTISCFGTALNIAAANCKAPVCVWTPATERAFREQTGLEQHPLFEPGMVAIATSETRNIVDLIWSDNVLRATGRTELSRKIDPSAFADAIESIV